MKNARFMILVLPFVFGVLLLAGFVPVNFGHTQAIAAEVDARMLRFPDVSETHIVFVYDNDVWIAPKTGGTALPLSSPEGPEQFPKFSPDGQTVAFSANYDGNYDIYTLPIKGGIPKRLTYHPYPDRMLDYSPDGRVIFASYRTNQMETRFYYAHPDGGLPEALPPAYGGFGSISPDGKTLAFSPFSREFATWKRYQGGTAADIWLFDLKTYDSQRITTHPGSDDLPMFSEDKLYYLSDAGKENRRNIWLYNLKTGASEQVTKFKDFDVRWPSVGPSEIVFEYGGKLMLLDLKLHTTREVNIQITGDHPKVRPQVFEASEVIFEIGISPNAKRVVLNARGDIWTVPATEGYPRNLTRTDSVAERSPSWSPDGQGIAYFSDATGEYELYISQSDGSGDVKQLTKNGSAYRYNPVWSPDSKKISFSDKSGAYFVHLIDSGETVQMAKDPLGMLGGAAVWAKDSNWLSFAVGDEKSWNSVVMLYDLKSRKLHQVTSPMFSSGSPAFDLSGEWLFFTTNRSLNPIFGDVDESFLFANTTIIVAAPLRADVKSPFAPVNDDEEIKKEEEKKENNTGAEEKDAEKKDEPEILKIDIEGLEKRAMTIPISNGNYWNLQAGSKKVFYIRGANTGEQRQNRLMMYDLSSKQEAGILEGVGGFRLTPDASKMLVSTQQGIFITNAGPGAQLGAPVNVGGLKVEIDPRKEWRQVVTDVWRIYRDFFYDPGMHGVDWKASRDQALGLLKHAANREDVSYIIGEMLGELNVGHAYVWSAPGEWPKYESVGLLGCDFEYGKDANGASGVRISKIYGGADWELDVRGPLSQQGVEVQEGDFLLAVNGIPLSSFASPYAAFLGMAGKTTSITVSEFAARSDKDRNFLVTPTANDLELRLRNWIEENRERVYEKTGGKVGYIYVRNTSRSGLIDLQRQFIGQHMLDALIIDERWNGGGMLPHRFVELLNRPLHNYWARRDGASWRSPLRAHIGPKVMLINHAAGSGGDAFPYYFKQLGLGKLVGTRTWGGLVGISGNPGLIDGGYCTVPTFAIYELDGTWAIEGHGVDPDVLVIDNPAELARGKDPQLDKGIEVVMDELRKNPPFRVKRPAYPDRSGSGIPQSER